MENYFSIGELAKYQNVSKQTLIFYDRIGLFCPAFIDPNNGYRYYSSEQIDYLDTILIMKKIGFSLNEIKEHMQNYNVNSSLAVLGKQISVIDARINELCLIRNRLEHRCKQMDSALTYMRREIPIIAENAPEQYLYVQPVSSPYSLKEISIATKKCFSQAFQNQLPIYFQCGVIVPWEHIKEQRYTAATFAFLPIEQTDKTDNVMALPSGKCVSAYHIGNYLSIGESYEKIIKHCAVNSLEIISDSYEFCINDYITSFDENEYITKIMFYIRDNSL